MADYTLTAFSPVLDSAGWWHDITADAKNWERSIRLNGGPWLGSFTLDDKLESLLSWFNNGLGVHIEERSGGALTWSGMVYDMELNSGGLKQWRSLDNMFNAVNAIYAVSKGGMSETGFIGNNASMARYGRKDNILAHTYVSSENATDIVNLYLAENAHPWPRPKGLSLGSTDKASLTVGVTGYVYTANWRYLSQEWDDDDDLDVDTTIHDWLDAVLGDTTRLQFLTLGINAANTLSVKKYQATPVRIWDWAQNLIKRGDGTSTVPYHIWVSPQRTINVGLVDVTPQYYIQGGKLTDVMGAPLSLTPWQIQPAVIRNLQYPMATIEPGNMLSDGRDILVDEVSVNSNGEISFRTTDTSPEEIATEQSLRWREDMQAWYQYMDGIYAQQRREEQENWQKDWQKRYDEWVRTHPGGEPFPG